MNRNQAFFIVHNPTACLESVNVSRVTPFPGRLFFFLWDLKWTRSGAVFSYIQNFSHLHLYTFRFVSANLCRSISSFAEMLIALLRAPPPGVFPLRLFSRIRSAVICGRPFLDSGRNGYLVFCKDVAVVDKFGTSAFSPNIFHLLLKSLLILVQNVPKKKSFCSENVLNH